MTAPIGDNSGTSGERIRSFIERIEKLEEDRRAISDDIKEVYSEARSTGFDVMTIKRIVKERRKSLEQRKEQLELFELYTSAIGMEV